MSSTFPCIPLSVWLHTVKSGWGHHFQSAEKKQQKTFCYSHRLHTRPFSSQRLSYGPRRPTYMREDVRNNRVKLLGSLGILGFALILIAISQSTKESSSPEPGTQPITVRAVFGEEARPVAESSEENPPAPKGAQSPQRTESPVKDGEIHSLLNRWRIAFVSGNPDGLAILYAPRMDQFFRQRNASRATVRREKARMMELYPHVNRYEISEVNIDPSGKNEAVVTFRKDWDMRGDRRFTGSERQRLTLRKMQGDWKIVNEGDSKVYWVKRG